MAKTSFFISLSKRFSSSLQYCFGRVYGLAGHVSRYFIACLCSLLFAGGVFAADASTGGRSCELGDNSIFAAHRWPEQNLEAFSTGNLGVLDPRYDHFYLFIAYRNLIGKPLMKQEIERLRKFDPCWDDGTRGGFGYEWRSSPAMVDAQKSWEQARKMVFSVPVQVTRNNARESTVLGYTENYIPNCNADAFRNAARTLQQRITKYRVDPWVESWVEAQDQVFSHCEAKSTSFPTAAASNSPKWFQFDRAYQIAAAKFYAGEYSEAVIHFDAIALDTESPWSNRGQYLAARALIRQASLLTATKSGEAREQAFKKAQTRLTDLQRSTSDEALRVDVQRLLQRIGLNIDPYGTRAEIDERLSSSELPESLGQDVRDFDTNLAIDSAFLAERLGFGAWLLAFRQGLDSALPVSVVLPKTEAWLVVRLQSAKSEDKNLASLLAEAVKISQRSPAYPTVRYHMIRLEANHSVAMGISRSLLNDSGVALTRQDRNRIADVSLEHASSRTEFANLVYVQPLETLPEFYREGNTLAALPVVDAIGAKVLNEQLPLDVLYEIQQRATTPKRLREALLDVVWVRAFILERWDILQKLNSEMTKLLPDARDELRLISEETDPVGKKALAAIFLAKFPGLLPSISTQIFARTQKEIAEISLPNMHRRHVEDWDRANWWYSIPEGRYFQRNPAPLAPKIHPMLTLEESKRWTKERDAMLVIPNATDYFGKIVLEWAASHPKDSRLPKALRMIVRSARGGGISSESNGIGKRAFRHLHRHFPKSEEARLTRTHS